VRYNQFVLAKIASVTIVGLGVAVTLFVLFCFPHITHADLSSGLIGYWTFDRNDINWNTGIVADRSGSGNDGTLFGFSTTSSPVPGHLGQALNFVSANLTSVDINTDLVASGDRTQCAWVYLSSAMSNGYDLAPLFGNNVFLFAYFYTGSTYYVEFSSDGSHGPTAQLPSSPVRVWNHICYVRPGGAGVNGSIYLNGTLLDSGDDGDPTGGGGFISIGEKGVSNFDGKIDDVRIYNRLLSAKEIAQLYGFGAALVKPPNNLGLVGYWPMDEGTGSIVHDVSGFGANATTSVVAGSGGVSPTWTNGHRGGGLNFDGVGGYLGVSGTTQYAISTKPFTFAAWVNLCNCGGNGGPVVASLKTDTGQPFFILMSAAAGQLGFDIGSVTSWTDFKNGVDPAPLLGSWHHIVVTYNGADPTVSTNFAMYLDGVAQTLSAADAFSGSFGNLTAFGESPGGPQSNRWVGKLDDIRIYNRQLSATDVANLYDQGTAGATQVGASSATLDNGTSLGAKGGLVGHWTFDGQDMNWNTKTAIDSSGSGNNGDIGDFSTTASPAQGRLGQALNFLRANAQTVDLSSDLMASGDRTTCAWVYLNVPMQNNTSDMVFDSTSYTFGYFFITGGYYLPVSSDDVHQALPQLPSSPVRVWNHICAVRPGGTGLDATIYLNGQLLGSGDDGDPGSTFNLSIGGNASLHQDYFDGKIDDVRIYNRLLSPKEINQLYTLGTTIVNK
jgi:hypothetical protein